MVSAECRVGSGAESGRVEPLTPRVQIALAVPRRDYDSHVRVTCFAADGEAGQLLAGSSSQSSFVECTVSLDPARRPTGLIG